MLDQGVKIIRRIGRHPHSLYIFRHTRSPGISKEHRGKPESSSPVSHLVLGARILPGVGGVPGMLVGGPGMPSGPGGPEMTTSGVPGVPGV